jgi:hypothetical protein
MAPEPTVIIGRKAPKKVQHRLRSEAAKQLLIDYQAGVPINDLVARYGIDPVHRDSARQTSRSPAALPQACLRRNRGGSRAISLWPAPGRSRQALRYRRLHGTENLAEGRGENERPARASAELYEILIVISYTDTYMSKRSETTPTSRKKVDRHSSEGARAIAEYSQRLLKWGLALEGTTLVWNIVGIVVLTFAAIAARSVALTGFGLDSLIEIGASTVVIWELSGSGVERQRLALRIIGVMFIALAAYLAVQSTVVLVIGFHPKHSPLGIVWTAITALVMFALAAGKSRVGRSLGNPVLRAEGRVTLIDGILAASVMVGLLLNAVSGIWWADPAAGYVLLYYATREGITALRPAH